MTLKKAFKYSVLALSVSTAMQVHAQTTGDVRLAPGDKGYVKHMRAEAYKRNHIDELKAKNAAEKARLDAYKKSGDKEQIKSARQSRQNAKKDLADARKVQFDQSTGFINDRRKALDEKFRYSGDPTTKLKKGEKGYAKQLRSELYNKRKAKHEEIMKLRQKRHDDNLAAKEAIQRKREEHKNALRGGPTTSGDPLTKAQKKKLKEKHKAEIKKLQDKRKATKTKQKEALQKKRAKLKEQRQKHKDRVNKNRKSKKS